MHLLAGEILKHMPPSKKNKASVRSIPEIPLDELIDELISKRKIQQEALLKIQASMAKKQAPPATDQQLKNITN